jgi:putative membrane-bound dehydrogenase-like protein
LPATRVELVEAATQSVFFKASGYESETLRPVVVDLQKQFGKEIFIRIVDDQSGHWGHVNFDDFKFYAERPKFENELDAARVIAESPPADEVPFAGLSPEEAAKSATLPPGFKMHVFAAEPDVKQPIAFCLDDRGRVWVAEGYTYPRRRGNPPTDNRPGSADRSKPTPEQLKDIFGGADRILVLEDTDGDHKFDKRTVFLENLNLVSGLEIGFGGVWIGAAPYLMFVPVSDWDNPKPAGDPQLLLDGWNYSVDTHEVLNTFTWGPDGWLYGCHGVFCPSHVGKPGTPESERQWMDAGVWRYHPTRHEFEVFTEGGSNAWGIDFDEYGQLFAEMCVIPHFWHMIQGARIERQGGEHFCINRDEIARNEQSRDQRSRKPIYPFAYQDIKQHGDHVHWAGSKGPHAANARSDAVGGGHAHAGVMCYLGASWPEEYRGKLFIGNIHGQRLNMDIPMREGSGYVGKHGKDFLNFNDTWSQTLNQLYDQDGSVYVIDWYDKNQCHHNREDGHDRSNGRIYKIVYGDTRRTPVDLQKLSDEELVKHVVSKNEWMSRHSRRILQERYEQLVNAETNLGSIAFNSDAEAITALQAYLGAGRTNILQLDAVEVLHELKFRMVSLKYQDIRRILIDIVESNMDVTKRLKALGTLHVVGGIDNEQTQFLMRRRDEFIRAWAIQFLCENRAAWLHVERPDAPALSSFGPSKMNEFWDEFVRLSREDPAPLVRLYLASALQRMPLKQRWDILAGLVKHAEDAGDHNLPLMYWYAAEPCVASDPTRAVALLKQCKIPLLREFIARRLATSSLKTVANK